jgi:hypothetical protein
MAAKIVHQEWAVAVDMRSPMYAVARFMKNVSSTPIGASMNNVSQRKRTDMMNYKSTRALAVFSAAALAFGAFPSAPQARSMVASAGRPQFPVDYGCFSLSNSAMINGCSRMVKLETALVVDAEGWYWVRVNAQGPTTNSITCQAIGVNADSTSAGAPSLRTALPFDVRTPQTIALATYVPYGGALFVYCETLRDGRVNTINW